MRTQFSDRAATEVVGGPEPALQIDRTTGGLLISGGGSGGATAFTAAALDNETAMAADAKTATVTTTGKTITEVIGADAPFWVRTLTLYVANDSLNNVKFVIGGVTFKILSPNETFTVPIPEGGRINTATIRAVAQDADNDGIAGALFVR